MWYANALISHFNVPLSLFDKIQYITLDSRQAGQGSLFVAIKGEKVDGHSFLGQVQKQGAIAALVDQSYTHKHQGMFLIKVKDVRAALQMMAKRVIEFWKPTVIGITGSIGKTSTKDFIYTLVETTHSVHKTPGNYNSQLTLPLTILNSEQPHRYLVLEMGMDQPGELERLIEIAPPDIAVLTQLAHVHIEPFKTFERLAYEKCKIFKHSKTQVGIYNQDMPFSDLALKQAPNKKIACSLKNSKAHYFLKNEKNQCSLYKEGQLSYSFKPPLRDPKSLINLLFAIAVADCLNVTKVNQLKQIEYIQYPEKRMVQFFHKGVLYLNDAYNSCVESVENALLTLPQVKGRRIAVLSEMVEQGRYSKENHQKIAQHAHEHVDILIGFGKEMEVMIPIWRKSGKKWAFFVSYPLLLAYVSNLVKNNDAVLIKGARKHALERLIHDITTC